MKKRLLRVMIAVIMAVVTGCGNNEIPATDETVISTEEESESVDTDSVNTDVDTENTEETEEMSESTEETDIPIVGDKDSLNLEEYVYTFEDRSVEKEGETLFDLDDFEPYYEGFYLTDTVDIYAYNGVCIGYIKSGTSINTIGQNEEWGYISIDDKDRYVKMSEVRAVGFVGTKREYLASLEPKEETPSAPPPVSGGSVPSVPEVSQPEAVVPVEEAVAPVEEIPVEEVPVESDKYTPEEAIAVYRSLMEAGGITWNPSLKDVTSWGTGWIYLDKGDAEEVAASNLESFAIGSHGGDSWTEYYLEVTGSDEQAVYITEWHN